MANQEPNDGNQSPRSIPWTNVTIGPKEFIAAIFFVVSLSGVWYDSKSTGAKYRTETSTKITNLEADNAALKDRVKALEGAVKELADDKIRRDAIEDTRAQSGYVPMRRVK